MSRLDDAVAQARELDTWDGDRAARVREGVLVRRAARARRERALRRAAFVAGAAGLLVLALLRAASSAPSDPAASRDSREAVSEAMASRSLGDGGYARD